MTPATRALGDVARVTLQTIADRLGVSRMTVSNAFSRPDQLSDELRIRVLSAAQELGYVGPDPTARALARGTTGAVGVLLTDALSYAFSDEVSTIFLGALVDALAPTGMAVTLLTSNDRYDIVPARDVAIDGAIVYSCRPASTARDWLVRRKLPLVYVDQEPVTGASNINVDDRGGARAAAEHVIGLGHRDVGILTIAAEGAHPERQRMLGWRDALRAVDLEPAVAQASGNVDDEAINAALSILTGEHRPTALLCFSDIVALGALRARLRSSASRCPEMSRSSGSTTALWRAAHIPRSRPFVRTSWRRAVSPQSRSCRR